MAMVRISDKAMERLKTLANEGVRSLTNQLDVLLLKDTTLILDGMDRVQHFEGILETPPNTQTVTLPDVKIVDAPEYKSNLHSDVVPLKEAAATLNAMPGYHRQADLNKNRTFKPLNKAKK